MDKYFDYEDVEEEKNLRNYITMLKEYATLWWDELQADTRRKGKKMIKSWDQMVAKIKEKFLPKDYRINFFKRLQT